jgi:glucosamine--fructose-6-phosphate aminotransferase (isomerizing)
MCGIVGYVGKRPALDLLVGGLRRLEYRGYDSTGVAFFDENNRISVEKAEGKLVHVEKLLSQRSAQDRAQVHCGIGHTRWATHGMPSTQNAHPHQVGHVVLVHNGIIENYLEIKAALKKRGQIPVSETDSELFGFLVLDQMNQGRNLADAVRESFAQIHGSCSIVAMSEKEPGKIVAFRNGTPLAVAIDPEGGVILASDAQPLIEYQRKVIFLEDGEMVVARWRGAKD